MTDTAARCRAAGALLVIALAACVAPLDVPEGAKLACDTGADCPAPLVCLDAASLCVDTDAPCVDIDEEFRDADPADEGEACTDDDGELGVCRAGRCGSSCGDGIVDSAAGELCDLGEQNSDSEPDRCRTDCGPSRCGDGVVDRGESCDDDDALCDACLQICALETVDRDGAPGCEAPHGIALALAGVVRVVPLSGGAGFLYATVDDEIRRIDRDGGGDVLVYRHPEFVSDLAVSPSGRPAIGAGSAAEIWLLDDAEPNTGAQFVVDGADTLLMSDGALFTARTDGFGFFFARIDLDTLTETRLDSDVAFPTAYGMTNTRVVWTGAGDRIKVAPLAGAAGDVEVLATGVVSAHTIVGDGEDVWLFDALDDLYLIAADAPAGTAPRRVVRRPGALAGSSAFRTLAVRDGTFAAGFFFSGEPLDDSDDVATLLTGDRSGALSMRARTNGFYGSVIVEADVIWLGKNGAGLVEVPR